MKISHSIFLSFAFILLLFALTTLINFRLSDAVQEDAEYLTRSTNIIRYSGRFQRNVLTMVSGLRGYLLTGERSFIESYDAANLENDTILQELPALLTDSSQLRMLEEIRQLNAKWTDGYTEPLRHARMLAGVGASNLDSFKLIYREKYATGEEKDIQNQLQQKFRAFTNFEYEVRDARKEILADSVNDTRRLSVIFTAVSGITALLVIVFLVRRISRRIGQMTDMANTIAAGSYSVTVQDTGNDELSSLGHSLNHMAAELSKNISLLQRSNEELDQFAHIVSHDMKGPLRGIGNVVSWIEEDHRQELTPKVLEYLELIKGRIARAEALIAGLLSYARANKEEPELETIDVQALIGEVLESLPRNTRLQVVVEPMPVVHSQRLLLFQVFSNLIGNAIKYNDKEEGRVRIYYREQEDGYEFFVEDNGVGISENYHKRIFVIFQTLRDGDNDESTGVGLAIVKKILDSRKQQIRVVSEPGKGSVFSFTWPKY